MKKRDRQCECEWIELEMNLAQDCTVKAVEFVVQKLFKYNRLENIHDGNLEDKLYFLQKERIIPEEILKDSDMNENQEMKLIQWFIHEYKNYERVTNLYEKEIYTEYGKINTVQGIYSGDLNRGIPPKIQRKNKFREKISQYYFKIRELIWKKKESDMYQ